MKSAAAVAASRSMVVISLLHVVVPNFRLAGGISRQVESGKQRSVSDVPRRAHGMTDGTLHVS